MLQRLLALMLCAAVSLTVCAAGQGKKKIEVLKPVGQKNLWMSPGFNSCRIYFVSDKIEGITLEYREYRTNNKWKKVSDLTYITRNIDGKNVSCYRGNIVNILDKKADRKRFKNNVTFDFQFRCGKKVLASGAFLRTEPNRLKLIKPVKMGDIMLRPTFNSCSVYFGSVRRPGIALEFKKSGSDVWQKALTPYFFTEADDKIVMSEYRGSIVKLEENTSYDVRFTDGGKVLKAGKFTTWKSDVPVAKTIIIDPENFKAPYVISAKGKPDGWIRYTVKDGRTLAANSTKPVFEVKNAAYVLIDDMTITNGKGSQSVITVRDSKAVRVRNCDISGWGRVGVAKYDTPKGVGMYYVADSKGNFRAVNYDGAIYINPGSKEVVVERCYIHDPYSRANSWFYSHPAGPQAVICSSPDHSTVLRYNDFIGSDMHRFNDAVEGPGNFYCNGGINRDADVYGNYMIFSNDDCIELDGGQQNVRCFWNHFESALCGVSIQGCMTSPVYLFENVFSGMGDEFELTNASIKTGGGSHGPDATAFIFNNTFLGKGGGISLMATLRSVLKNNIFLGTSQRIGNVKKCPSSSYGSNSVAGIQTSPADGISKYDTKLADIAQGNYLPLNSEPAVKINNFLPDGGDRGAFQSKAFRNLPYRPIPVYLDRERIEKVTVKDGVVSPESVNITVTVDGDDFKSDYTICKNKVFDWMEITPAKGTLKSGDKFVLNVKFIPEKMNKLHNYRGAFSLRLANGFSRVVAVYASTDFVQPFKLEKEGRKAVYIDALSPKVTNAKSNKAAKAAVADDKLGIDGKTIAASSKLIYEYSIDVPEDGRYYFMIHGYSPRRARLSVSVDNDKFQLSSQQSKPYMSWTMLTPGKGFGNMSRYYDLKKGTHRLRIKNAGGEFKFDGIALIDDPESFEPKQ